MQQIEKPLDDAFKKVPQLPENLRKGLATAMPWLALIGGILSLIAAFNLYQAIAVFDQYVSGVYSAFGYASPVAGYSAMAWLGIIILALQAVLLLVAFPALRVFKKSGWNLILWADIASVAYSVVVNLFSGYVNVGQLIFMLIGAAVGLYLLFQIRPYYTAAGGAPAVTATPKAPATKEAEKPTDKTEPKV